MLVRYVDSVRLLVGSHPVFQYPENGDLFSTATLFVIASRFTWLRFTFTL